MVLDIQDIISSVSVPALIKDDFIRRGSFAKLENGDFQAYVGGFTIVFPVLVDGEKWAFRCWHNTVEDSNNRYKHIGRYLCECHIPHFCSFTYTEEGIVVSGMRWPTTRMRWAEGLTLKEYICKNYNNSIKVRGLADSFLELCSLLHNNHIAHGDLQHGNIIVAENGSLALVDYDSLYVPTMGNMFPDIITGLIDYQHPSRKRNKLSSEKLDYFSELVIYLSLLAISEKPSLVDKYQVRDTEALLFKASDYNDLPSSKVYIDLWGLSNRVRLHLLMLESYLKEDDINSLFPFTSDSARNKVEEIYWHKVVAAGGKKKEVLEDFLRLFPTGVYRQTAEAALSEIHENERRILEEDRRAWNQALISQSHSDFRYYINRFPEGEHIKEAKQWLKKYLEVLDEEEWRKAKKVNTVNSYRQYLECPTNVRYRTEAQRLINKFEDDEDWIIAKESNTFASYLAYRQKRPLGEHIAECKKIIEVFEDEIDWQKAVSASALSIYEEYVRKHPNGKHIADAQARINEFLDDNKWRYAVNLDTIFAYNLYKTDYPHGRHIKECEKRLIYMTEEAMWERSVASGSTASYLEYIRSYPHGRHIEECEKRLKYATEEEMWERTVSSGTIASYQDYLRSYSQGRHIKAARNAILRIRDDEAWRSAQKDNTVRAIRKYLEEYGENARHSDEANSVISQLKSGEKGWIVAIIITILCFFIAWYIITQSDIVQTTPSTPQRQSSGTVINNSPEINQLKAEIEERLSVKESVFKNGDSPGELGPIQSKIDRLRQYQDPSAESFQKRLDRLRK